jgi:hypothetical protein
MARTGRAALSVVSSIEPPSEGDPLERQTQISLWSVGQRECRAKRQHLYKPVGLTVFGKRVNSREEIPVGTRINIVEKCQRCRSISREADHITTPRGVRPLEDWKPVYGEYKGIDYLLPKGSGSLDDGDREELKGHMYLDNAKLKFVADDE